MRIMDRQAKIFVAGNRGVVGSAIVQELTKNNFSNLILRTSGELDLRDDEPGFINVGTGSELSIRQLAESISRIVEYKGRIVFNTTKPEGTLRKLMDPGKIHALGWNHRVMLEKGLREVYVRMKPSFSKL